MRLSIVKIFFLAGVCAASDVRANVIQVDQWLLAAGISDDNQTPSWAIAFFNVPANPFVNAHSVTLAGASSSAAYNFNWSAAAADFQTNCSFVGTGYPNANADIQRVNCEANIRVTPFVDALLSVQAHMDYDLGPGDRATSGGWLVSRVPNPAPIAFGNFHEQPAFGDPRIGAWDDQESLTLLAGNQYMLRYSFVIDANPGSGTQSQLSHGNASVLFHIAPVPEPTSAGLLAFGAYIGLCRRRCSQKSNRMTRRLG